MKETGDRGQIYKAKAVCDNHQDIGESQIFLSQTMEDRSKTLYRKKLYYGCLCEISKEHSAKSWANERLRKVCFVKHPTVFRVFRYEENKMSQFSRESSKNFGTYFCKNWQFMTINAHCRQKTFSPPPLKFWKSSPNGGDCPSWWSDPSGKPWYCMVWKLRNKENNEDTDIKEKKPEEEKCESINSVSIVISMCTVPLQIKSKDSSKTVHTYALLDSCNRQNSYWTNWQMTLEYLEVRPHL